MDVVLTEEEAQQALYNAKWEKYKIIKAKENEANRRRNEELFKRKWSADQMYEYVQYRISLLPYKFQLDDHNNKIISALCYFFTDDERFVELGKSEFDQEWSLSKGLLLRGAPGRGKSEIIKLFTANPKQSFEFYPTETIGSRYKELGDDVLGRFASFRPEVPSYHYFFQQKIGVVYDDLGREDPAGHYEKPINYMQKIIQIAYDNKNIPWYMRHATTMYNWQELEEKYGYHIRSRMREMFNDIVVSGDDRRK